MLTNLPANRLGFATPWGMGEILKVTYHDDSLSGMGVTQLQLGDGLLSIEGNELLVSNGEWAAIPIEQVVFLRWNTNSFERLENPPKNPDAVTLP